MAMSSVSARKNWACCIARVTPRDTLFSSVPQRALAIVGDVLFAGSIGRTDFPRGNHATLVNSIRHKLWPLGKDVAFIPGHGPMSNFGDERESNPYVATTLEIPFGSINPK